MMFCGNRPARRPIRSPVDDFRDGRLVVLQSSCQGPSYLVLSGELATVHLVALMVRWTTGFLRATVTDAIRHRLELPLLSTGYSESGRPQFAVSVDASRNITTGISAADRAHTVRMLADPMSSLSDFTRPGHVVPVRIAPEASAGRWSAPEYSAMLAHLGGLGPVTLFSEITDDRGQLAHPSDVLDFAEANDVAVINCRDLFGAAQAVS
jgi:3,4-dihydroxy 2-butanone 4-phosphate synthase / GTP cyclohydrolase II